MGIFRGVGGVGDADTDAFASEVNEDALTAEQKANEAAASAAQAAASATQAASSASSASSDAAEAAASISTVISAKDAAEDARDTAIAAKDTAVSAQAATATSETNAAASAASSSSSATAAAASETSAAASATSATASANTATTKATEAATSATNALASANAAANSATEAATVVQGIQDDVTQSAANAAAAQAAADNAIDLEAQAAASAANALNSATAAAGSATSASASAATATTKATQSANSATAALASEAAAASSETASAASEAAAAASVTAATTQATNAATSASQAATSASNSADSATLAAASEAAAASSEANAANSATAASGAQTAAASSAAAALSSQTAAATSASSAATSASSATTSATSAASSAATATSAKDTAVAAQTSASSSASAASTSATNAATSALAADQSAQDAQSIVDGLGVVASITSGDIANWDAAHSWGDHSLVGYVEENTSPTFANVSVTGLTVTGDLEVQGTTTTVNSTNLAIADNLIYLNDGNTTANVDLGWVGNYNDGTYAHTGVYRDATDGRFKFFDSYTPEPDQTNSIDPNHASFSFAPLQVDVLYATGGNSGQWNTAYSWGDHSLAGYADSTSVQAQIDGVVATLNTSNWDTAYSWGNHATAGYLTSFTETDPVFSASPASGISSGEISNWNTAYSWGNHAGLYAAASHTHAYLPSSHDMTLTLSGDVSGSTTFTNMGNATLSVTIADDSHNHTIANIDGLQSALDGKAASSHSHSNYVIANTTSNANIDSDWGQSFKTFDPIPSGTPPLSSPNIRTINVGENYARRTQIAFNYATDQAWFRRRQDSTWYSWREFIHSGNIGSQSVSYATSAGNADTLDGSHASAFAAASHSHNYISEGGTGFSGTYPVVVRVGANNYYSNSNITFNGTTNGLTVGGRVDAPIYYDSNNTAYYVDPASTSNFNALNVDRLGGYTNAAYQDITVGGDANTYYPVTISPGAQFAFERYSISRGYNWAAPNTWNTSTHRGGLTFTLEWCGDGVWGGNNKDLRVIQFAETYSTMVAGLALATSNDYLVVWLRGGNAQYRIHSPKGSEATVTVYTSGFTASNGSVFSPRTSTSSVSSEIYARMPVRGTSTVYDNNYRVVHEGGDQTKSGYLQSNSSLRAPIFYDSNNTGYYCDPASTSNVNNITHNGSMTWNGHIYWNASKNIYIQSGECSFDVTTGAQWRVWDTTNSIDMIKAVAGSTVEIGEAGSRGLKVFGTLQVNPTGTSSYIYMGDTDHGYRYIHNNSNQIGFLDSANGWGCYADDAGNWYSTDSVRAPIFYDSNDTGYYVNPNGGNSRQYGRFSIDSNRSFTGVESHTSAGGRGQLIVSSYYSDVVIASQQANDNHGSTLSFTAVNPSNSGDYRKFVINQGNWGTAKHLLRFGYADAVYTNPHNYVTGSFGGSYDVMGLDGANKIVYAFGQLRTPIMYDYNNTGYYCDPAGGSNFSTLTCQGNALYIRGSSPTLYFRDTNNRSAMIHNNSSLLYILRGSGNDSTSWASTGAGWPLTVNLENNDATFGGNVTAYSDARLKENFRPLGITLEQFKSVKAKRFDWIESGKHDIGFIAQDVEAAGLVEVVKDFEQRNPETGELNETYKTLDYSRMVAMLWDVVSQQQTQIEALASELKSLKENT